MPNRWSRSLRHAHGAALPVRWGPSARRRTTALRAPTPRPLQMGSQPLRSTGRLPSDYSSLPVSRLRPLTDARSLRRPARRALEPGCGPHHLSRCRPHHLRGTLQRRLRQARHCSSGHDSLLRGPRPGARPWGLTLLSSRTHTTGDRSVGPMWRTIADLGPGCLPRWSGSRSPRWPELHTATHRHDGGPGRLQSRSSLARALSACRNVTAF